MNERKTVALVPAYNEEPRIARVLEVITSSPLVNEIIVLDDGSRDKTSEIASRFPVKVLRWEQNRGKGAVLQSGLEKAPDADYYLFLDADLINFNIEHIEKILTPLTWPEPADMTIGVFKHGNKNHVNMAQHYFSVLNGQRALRREFVEILPDLNWSRFGVEILLTRYAALAKRKVSYPELHGITHVTKEEKLGFFGGFCHRLQMYQECVFSLFVHKKMIKRHPGKVPPDILKKI
ncbi:MAG: glycosyltransferase family 2 protein [Bacillota bacterium]|nr:glycosyltransferase family 2 protein [Bacillota bacterium]